MWELDHKESWVPKNWCFWTVVLKKTLESPLDSKEIKPVNAKGNQSWIFIGRTDAEAETPILWPPDSKNWLIRKDPDDGKDWKQWQTIFLGFKITADSDCSHEIKRHLLLGRKTMINVDRVLKKQRHWFANKGLDSQSYVFSSSHVCMWELDHNEGWATKNWCFWTVVLEKTLESPLDCKEIKPVNPKGSQPWIFLERTDIEA